VGAQALDRPGDGGVDLVGQADHEDKGFHVAVTDTAGVGTEDAQDECAVLVVLDLRRGRFGVTAALTSCGPGTWVAAGDVLAPLPMT
jgi:hypothetical protein